VIPAISIVGEGLSRNRNRRARYGGATGFTGFRDDEGMPLICPTCQIVFRRIHAGLLLCMGLF
jgi:hypothetical protein